MRYAIKLIRDGDAYVASCRDLPAFNSVGDTEAEAVEESVDAMTLVVQWHIDNRLPVPVASEKKHGEQWVNLPALDAAKVGLYEAMQARRIRKSDLARKLGVHAPQVDRLLDLTHKSKLDQVEHALAVLGYRMNVSVEPVDNRRAA